jgi:hypothetical protein
MWKCHSDLSFNNIIDRRLHHQNIIWFACWNGSSAGLRLVNLFRFTLYIYTHENVSEQPKEIPLILIEFWILKRTLFQRIFL